jgi:hypothetical protein
MILGSIFVPQVRPLADLGQSGLGVLLHREREFHPAVELRARQGDANRVVEKMAVD